MSKKKRAIRPNDLENITVYSSPVFTPNGAAYTYISTQIKNDDYTSQIFHQSIDNNEQMQWTFHNKKDSQQSFSPDGEKLVFQSNRSGRSQIWLINTKGGEAKQITSFKYGAVNPTWSKDGKSIIFTASLEKDDDLQTQTEQSKQERQKENEAKAKQPIVINKLKHKSDAGGFFDEKYAQIILYSLENNNFTQLTSGNVNHHFEDISPDNDTIIFSSNLNDDADYENNNHLYTLKISTKEIKQLTTGNGSYSKAKFSPSGKEISFLGHDFAYQGATINDLFIMDLTSQETTCLSENWDMQIGDFLISDMRLGTSNIGPTWSNDEQSLYVICTQFGKTSLYKVNRQGNRETIFENNNHLFGFTYNPVDETFILGISTPTNPGDFYLLENNKELKQLTNSNQDLLEQLELSEPEELTITTNDNWEVQGWLLKPFGFEEGKKYPFILQIHGGPHMMYGQSFFHEMQLLAAKGYVVLYTNPRGSDGYGQKFVDAVRGDYGGNDYQDLMTAVDYVLDNYNFIDHDRLGVTGGSYGGFMTNWIVGQTNRFKAAVTQRSISNWISFYGVSDIGYFFTEWELKERALDNPENLWNFSPIKHVKNVKTPLLILHGEQDLRCPIEQAEQLFIALKHLRKEVEFVRFPGANHELSRSGKPSLRIERLNHICRWFKQYL